MSKKKPRRINAPGLLSSPEGYGNKRLRVTADIDGTERYIYKDLTIDEDSAVLTKTMDRVVTTSEHIGTDDQGKLKWKTEKKTVEGDTIPRMPISEYAQVIGVDVGEEMSDQDILNLDELRTAGNAQIRFKEAA